MLAFLSRPLWAAILFGCLASALTYRVGNWSIEPHDQIDNQKLDLAIQRVAKSFFIADRSTSRQTTQRVLREALHNATLHPRVFSATIRSSKNEVIEAVYKNTGTANRKNEELTLPLLDGDGRVLGQVFLELANTKNPEVIAAQERILVWSVVAFFLAGFFCYVLMTQKREDAWPVLIHTLKEVAAGRLDVKVPIDPKQKELSETLNQMVDALQERDRMRHSLGRIMDPKIAEALIKEDPKLGGRTRQATILFCDIRNYTSICEELTSDELQTFLNEYWKGTVEIIMEQEGTIDKFHGDGVCVVFGAPNLHEDDPLRAVRTAWRLVGNVAAINERRAAQRKTPIHIGIGIHTGEVIAGHIGSERRMDYTVVGDVVNVAARIEELNKKFGTEILISDNVYEKVEPAVRVRTLTLAHLRGHKRPILIHALKEFHDPVSSAQNREAA